MDRRYYMGIDQGTTGTTVLLLDEKWSPVAETHTEHKQYYPQPGWVEHDPEELMDKIMEAAEGALKKADVSAEELACIGIDNQGETIVVWDKTTGKAVYAAIVWQDRRTADEISLLPEETLNMIREKTGLNPDAYFGATKIRWVLDNMPGVRKRAEEGNILAGPSDAWFLWKMTNGEVFATDQSTASRTMLFNIHTLDWDDELLGLFNIPRSILPEIKDSACVYGNARITGADGKTALVPISANAVDQEAALFGQACLTEGTVKTTYGTGCFMLMNTGNRRVFSKEGLLTSVAWKLQGRDTEFEIDGGIYAAGSVITWMKDHLKILDSAKDIDPICNSVPDTAGVVFVPALTGLAAPYWDQYARGTILGITPGTERAHIIRAAMESIAYQVKDILDLMEKESGIKVRGMRADGGITKSDFMMQFQADILGIPVDVPAVSEATALGIAYMAAFGIGRFSELSELEQNWRLKKRFLPRMSESERKERMQKWYEAVKRASKWAEEDKAAE